MIKWKIRYNITCVFKKESAKYEIQFWRERTRKTIVLVHSYLWDREMWREQIDLLSEQYRCIAIDLPSHGSCLRKLPKNYCLEDLAKELIAFWKKGNWKYHYIGLSVGGMLIPYLYENDKDKIESFVMMDSYVGAEGEEKKLFIFIYWTVLKQWRKFRRLWQNRLQRCSLRKKKNSSNPDYVKFINRLQGFSEEQLEDIVILGRAIFGREEKRESLKILPFRLQSLSERRMSRDLHTKRKKCLISFPMPNVLSFRGQGIFPIEIRQNS